MSTASTEGAAPNSDILRGSAVVRLLRDEVMEPTVLAGLHEHLSQHGGPWRFLLETNASVRLSVRRGDVMSWTELFDALRAVRRERNWSLADVLVLVTARPNELGWFSSVEPERNERSIFIHGRDWDWITSAPVPAILAHETVQNLLLMGALPHGVSSEQLAHRSTTGCIMDYCERKADAALKLRTADICGSCLERLEALGAAEANLRQAVSILENCRRTAVSTARYQPPHGSRYELPHPVAVTKHKVSNSAPGSPTRLRCLLDHADCMLRHACFQLAILMQRHLDLPSNPSLGSWISLMQQFEENASASEARLIAERGLLAHRRNDHAHGYLAPGLHESPEGITELEHLVSDIERALIPLHQVELASIEHLEPSRAGYLLSGRLLHGSNLLFRRHEWRLPPGLDPVEAGITSSRIVVFHRPSSHSFDDCAPFYRLVTCPECHHERLLMRDSGTTERYLDTFMGHRATLDG